jgi:hypothetical protein
MPTTVKLLERPRLGIEPADKVDVTGAVRVGSVAARTGVHDKCGELLQKRGLVDRLGVG